MTKIKVLQDFRHRIEYQAVLKSVSKMLLALIIFSALSLSAQAETKLTLSDFLNQVQERNLDLKIEQSKTKVAEANAIGIRLPDPMIALDHMKENGGGSAFGYEVSQNLPFPTKIFADRSARKNMSAAQKAFFHQRQNEIFAEAKLAFLEAWISQQRVKFLEQKEGIFKEHLKISRSQARSDSFLTIHALKMESDLDLLQNEMEVARQDVKERLALLSKWINKDIESFHPEIEEPEESFLPELSKQETLNIQSKRAMLESASARLSESRSAWLPDLAFKYKEMGKTAMSPQTQEIMVGVSVPLAYFWQPYAANQKAAAEKTMADAELQKQNLSNDVDRTILLSRIESYKRQLDRLKVSLIPRAKKRAHISHGISLRDMESLQTHQETLAALPDLQLKALEVRFAYEKSIADLEKIFGGKRNEK